MIPVDFQSLGNFLGIIGAAFHGEKLVERIVDVYKRQGQGITPLHEALYKHVREKVAFFELDREIWPDIAEVEKMVRSGELLEIVKEYMPDFQ